MSSVSSQMKPNTEETKSPAKAVSSQTKLKPRYSAFLITLNSQAVYTKLTPADKRKFKALIETIFDKDNIAAYLTDRTNPGDARAHLIDTRVTYEFEVGSKFSRLHMHGYLRVVHTGIYTVDVRKMRTVCERVLGKQIHLDVRGMADTDAAWTAYLKKNAGKQKVEL
jgi:hypothetical protein